MWSPIVDGLNDEVGVVDGCEFCNGSEIKDGGFIFSIDKDNDLEAYHYDESLFGYLAIKFCPICGKKL